MQKARAPNRKAQRGGQEAGPEVKKFGDFLTADHIITRNELSIGGGAEKTAIIIRDKHSKWFDGYPLKDKTTDETVRALQQFAGPQKVRKVVGGFTLMQPLSSSVQPKCLGGSTPPPRQDSPLPTGLLSVVFAQ
jgi:hypothetical protein